MCWLPSDMDISCSNMVDTGNKWKDIYANTMIQAFLVPLQGFWNAFIYFRPRYLRYRRTMPNASRLYVMLATLSEGKKKQQMRRRGQKNGGGRDEEDVGLDDDSDFHSLNEQTRLSILQRIIRSSKHSWKRGSTKGGIANENEKDCQVEIEQGNASEEEVPPI